MFLTPIKISFKFAAGDTYKDFKMQERGDFNYMFLKTPNFSNNVNTNILIIDPDGDIVWDMTEALHNNAATSKQGMGSTIRYQFDWDIPVFRGYTMRAMLTGAPGGSGGTVLCKLWVKANK